MMILRRTLLVLIAVAAAWAFLVAFTGGFDLRPGIDFKSTDADRPLYAAVLLTALYVAVFRQQARADAARLGGRAAGLLAAIERRATRIAATLSAITFGVGVTYCVAVAGGSDSYGYISQADLWLAASPLVEQRLALDAPWPDADATLAPLGYRPGPRPGTIVPVYPSGLPILMAAAKSVLGLPGVFLVVPVLGALFVWWTYRLGARVSSPTIGVASAALMATSPVFLFMLMNPMSDVPVSAFLLLAALIALSDSRHRAIWTAVAVSIAIWIRPNLAPLGAVYLAMVVARAPSGRRWAAALAFALAGLPFMLTLGAVNAYLYGAPWNAGYGSPDQFYAWRHMTTNVAQYGEALLRVETPFALLAAVAVFLIRQSTGAERQVYVFLVSLGVTVAACYAFYTPFDTWWYLRFFLPAFPVLFVFAAVGFARLLPRLAGRHAVLAGVLFATAFTAFRIKEARDLGVFDLWKGAIVYSSPSEYVRTRLPENTIVLTVQHSGSVRYYSGRMTLRWDLLAPEWWPRVLDVLVERGYRPYLVVAGIDEAPLRRHFGLSDAPDAPGTLVAEMTLPEPVRIYDPLRETSGPPQVIPQLVPSPWGVNTR
jgi:hypothetical protein